MRCSKCSTTRAETGRYSFSVEQYLWQPEGDLEKRDAEPEADELQNHERNDPGVKVRDRRKGEWTDRASWVFPLDRSGIPLAPFNGYVATRETKVRTPRLLAFADRGEIERMREELRVLGSIATAP